MKRIATLLLAAAFVFGSIAGASAADIKTTGSWDFAFEWTDNTNFNDTDQDGDSEDDFAALQRIRVQSVITASENVSGTLFFEIGNVNWGVKDQGGALSTDGINVETRRAYIDFAVPGTALDIRIGLQGIALPSAVGGNPILDDDMGAIVASYAFNDMFALTGFWARLYNSDQGDFNDNGNIIQNSNAKDEFDAAGLILDVNGDGFSVDPYFMYAWIGKNVADAGAYSNLGDDTTAWWLGTAFEMTMFDPIVFAVDFVYSDVDGGDIERNDASGWFVSSKVNYKMDMFTPGIWAWYGTGNDDDDRDGSEMISTISPSGFAPTSFGFDGAAGILTGGIVSVTGAGTWGTALVAEDIKFIEDVTHTVRFAYYAGTSDNSANNADMLLVEDDYAFEINFDTNYQIYENLSAAFELGWIKLERENIDNIKRDDTSDAWKAGVNLTYSF